MADANGNNDGPLLAIDLGALAFDAARQEPIAIASVSAVDSVGLFDFISASSERFGEDIADYFSFMPSGLNTITVTLDNLNSGTFANMLWIAPVSGVTKVTGDLIGSWYGGVNQSSSTVYRSLIDDSAIESLKVFKDYGLASADVSEAGWNPNDRDGISAVWTLDGSPVIFEVVGFNINGAPDPNFLDNPNATFQFSDVAYSFEIAPLDRALGNTGPEPPPVCRRLIYLSYAAMSDLSRAA